MIPLSLQPSDLSDQVAGAAEMSGSWESALTHAHCHCCVWPFIAMAIKQWLSFLENKHIYKSLDADKVYLHAGNKTGFKRVLNFW